MKSLGRLRTWEKYFWPLLASGLILMLWHFSVRWTRTTIFPSPMDVERGLAELMRKGLLWRYILDSLGRVAAGYLSAAVIGIPAGLFLGWYPAAAGVVNPTIQIVRPISPI